MLQKLVKLNWVMKVSGEQRNISSPSMSFQETGSDYEVTVIASHRSGEVIEIAVDLSVIR
ncbi:MAG: hypothetical protein ACOYEN_00410 [Limnochordia bacterium]